MKIRAVGLMLTGVALAAASGYCADDGSVVGTAAETIFAEAIGVGETRALSPAELGYNPSWASPTNITGGKVVISMVEHPDTDYATTTVVAELPVDEVGTYDFTLPATAESVVRLLHETKLDGKTFGDVLSADIAFGKASNASTAFFAATATNALTDIALAKGVAPLAYSTDWTNGVASVRIDYAFEQVKRGKKYDEGAGTLFAANADATGIYGYDTSSIVGGGDYTLTYTMLDADGEVIDTYTALFSLPVRLGMMLMLK